MLPAKTVEETSGAKLAQGGVTELKKLLTKLEKGGLLFIDEAYQLEPTKRPGGAEVLNFLLPEMENQRGKLVVVLAGYQKHMEELLAFNEGLPSRFPRVFTFPDYSDDELLTILQDLVASRKPRFSVADPKILRIAARRLGMQRGTTGFGNARAVRNLYEQARARQASRVQALNEAGELPENGEERRAAMLRFEREDFLGPRELDFSSCKPLQELEAMVGLGQVKKAVKSLLEMVKTKAELEDREEKIHRINLNRLFLGNPGTGSSDPLWGPLPYEGQGPLLTTGS